MCAEVKASNSAPTYNSGTSRVYWRPDTSLKAWRAFWLTGPRALQVEELRFIRQEVALVVVKTFDIKRAGVPTTGEENARHGDPGQGRWTLKVNASSINVSWQAHNAGVHARAKCHLPKMDVAGSSPLQ